MDKGYLGGGADMWGQIELRNLNAAPAVGFHQLLLDFDVTYVRRPPRVSDGWTGPIFFAATAHVGRPAAIPSRLLGPIQFGAPFFVLHTGWRDGFTTTLQGMLPLTRAQLEEIESSRDGDDLAIRLDFHVLASGDAALPFFAQFVARIGKSEWVRLLEQMGFQRTLLIEIPLTDVSVPPAASEHLAHAVNAMTRGPGGYREAVAQCRDAIEALREAQGDKADEDAAASVRGADLESLSKNQRVLLVRRALHRLTSYAKHPTPEEWNRSDAMFITAMVASLMRLSAH